METQAIADLNGAALDKIMEMLNYPNRRLKIIRVSGSNNAGHVSDVLNTILLHSNYQVGVYAYVPESRMQSIAYNGHEIETEIADSLKQQLEALMDLTSDLGLEAMTDEEITAVTAIVYFAREACPDFVIWQTSDNSGTDLADILFPIVSVIADDRADVSLHAAAIRPGIPVISGIEQASAVAELDKLAASKKSTHYSIHRNFKYRAAMSISSDLQLHFEGPYRNLEFVRVVSGKEEEMGATAIAIMASELLRQLYAALIMDDWHRL